MRIVKFEQDRDLHRLEEYLRERYLENRRAISWLPERLHDLIYRVGMQEADEGRERSADHIYMWEEDGDIAACILPDGENIYVSIGNGWERLFPSMIEFSEKKCLPLFNKADDGSVKFWFAVDSGLTYMREALIERGYSRYPEEEYLNCAYPMEMECSPVLPKGFRLLYGEDYPNEEEKWSALRLSFHPDWEKPDYKAPMAPYMGRKNSSMYRDSFECVVVDDDTADENKVCAYCFVYVDRSTGTAMAEPVGTREKYRRKGFGTALMHAAVSRCGRLGIEKCCVDSFGWRRDFYIAAGFRTETSIEFWYQTLNASADMSLGRNGEVKLSAIFEEKPSSWGFRGDPYFWDHLKGLAENMEIISPDELEEWIKREYHAAAGKPLTDEYGDFAVIKQFAHGGMSSGGVDNEWWMETGIPLLKSRLAAL